MAIYKNIVPSPVNSYSLIKIICLALISNLILSGCGGGSSSSSQGNAEPRLRSLNNLQEQYTGSTQAAELTGVNVGGFAVMYAFIIDFVEPYLDPEIIDDTRVIAATNTGAVKERLPCENTGTTTVSNGFTDDKSKAWARQTFNQCYEGGSLLQGTLEYVFTLSASGAIANTLPLQIKMYDLSFGDPEEALIFNAVISVQGSSVDDLRYSMDMLLSSGDNMAFIDNYKGYRSNLASTPNMALTARIFDSEAGYMDVSSADQLEYSTYGEHWPIAGGPVEFKGADNQWATLEFIDDHRQLWIEYYSDEQFVGGVASTWHDLDFISSDPGTDSSPSSFPRVRIQDALTFGSIDVSEAETILLDGRYSSDAEVEPLSFQWALVGTPDGSNAILENTDQPLAQLKPDRLGRYEVELRVTDKQSNSNTATYSFTVKRESFSAPTVAVEWQQRQQVEGIDDPLRESIRVNGVPIELDFSASEMLTSDGLPLDFITLDSTLNLVESPAGSAPQIESTGPMMASFTPDLPGIYRLEFIISDGLNTYNTPIEFNVKDYSDTFKPLLTLTSDPLFQLLPLGETYRQRFYDRRSGYDLGPAELEWQLTAIPAESSIVKTYNRTGTIQFTPDVAGQYEVAIRGKNSLIETDWQTFNVTVYERTLFQREELFTFEDQDVRMEETTDLFFQDMNGDGLLDFFLSGFTMNQLFYGSDEGGFNSAVSGYFNYSVYGITDLFGTGTTNLILGAAEELNIYDVSDTDFVNQQRRITLPGSLNPFIRPTIAINDFDSDGDKDFLITSGLDSLWGTELTLYEQSDLDVLTEKRIANLSASYTWWNIQWVDMNNDGLDDIVVMGVDQYYTGFPQAQNASIGYLIQKDDGSFTRTQYLRFDNESGAPQGFGLFTDINADGQMDLVSVNGKSADQYLGLWTMYGQELVPVKSWLDQKLYSGDPQAQGLWVEDIDLDGRADIVLVHDDAAYFLYQTDDMEFDRVEAFKLKSNRDSSLVFTQDYRSQVQLIDYDNDGDKDLVVLETKSPGKLLLYRNQIR